MNQPTTIDFDKADGMTSTQVNLKKGRRTVKACYFSGYRFDPSTAGKWRVDSIKICQVPKCAKSSTIHKVKYTWRSSPFQLKFQGQSSRRGSDCCGSTAYHRCACPLTFSFPTATPWPLFRLGMSSHFISGEPHTERHVGAQGRFLSVPEEFTLS